MSKRKRIIIILFVLTAPTIYILYSAVNTTYGLRSIYYITKRLIPGNLNIDDISGTLRKGVSFSELNYYSENQTISISDFKSKWWFNILTATINITELSAKEIGILLSSQIEESPENKTGSDSTLPDWLNIKSSNVTIEHLILDLPDSPPYLISQFKGDVIFSDEVISLRKTSLEFLSYAVNIDGLVKMEYPFFLDLSVSAKDSLTSQTYIFKGFGDFNETSGLVKAFPHDNLALDYVVNLTDNKLTISCNWLAGNIQHSTSNKKIEPGKIHVHADVQLAKKQTNNILRYLALSRFNKTHIENGISISNYEISSNYGGYSLFSAGNINYFDDKQDIQIKLDINSSNSTAPFHINSNINLLKSSQNYNIKIDAVDKNNKISIAGKISNEIDLQYQINIDDISKYYHNFTGTINGHGFIKQNDSLLYIKAIMDANNVSIYDIHASKIYCNMNINPKSRNGSLEIENFSFNDINISHLSGKTFGKSNNITTNLSGDINNYKILLSANLPVENPLENIRIPTLKISDINNITWQLNKPIQIQHTQDGIKLSELHLISDNSYIKLAGDYINSKNFNVTLDINTNLQKFITYTHPIEVDAMMRITANIIASNNILEKSDIELSSNNINITNIENNALTQLGGIYLKNIASGNTLELNSKISLLQNDSIEINLLYKNTYLDHYPILYGGLNGKIISYISNFTFLDPFLDIINQTSGKLTSDIKISGTLADPKINGEVKISKGNTLVEFADQKISNINVDISLMDNSFYSKLTANSDPGNIIIHADGKISRYNIYDIDVSESSKNFRIFNTSKIIVDLDSELKVKKFDDLFRITGNLNIPNGSITIDNFSNVDSESNDIILDNEVEVKKSQNINYDIKLKTSKPIAVKAYGLNATASGEIRLLNNHAFLHACFGRASLSGIYKFFNNKLTIKKGELSYAGTNISNPSLDILASKKLLNTQSIESKDVPNEVGVIAVGSIKNPEINFYSNPSSFSHADILSYLAFGKSTTDISNNSRSLIMSAITLLQSNNNDLSIQDKILKSTGIDEFDIKTEYENIPEDADDLRESSNSNKTTNVILGKRISNKISLQYQYNVSDRTQVIRAIYDLSKNWRINAEGSTDYTALNAIYHIEFL